MQNIQLKFWTLFYPKSRPALQFFLFSPSFFCPEQLKKRPLYLGTPHKILLFPFFTRRKSCALWISNFQWLILSFFSRAVDIKNFLQNTPTFLLSFAFRFSKYNSNLSPWYIGRHKWPISCFFHPIQQQQIIYDLENALFSRITDFLFEIWWFQCPWSFFKPLAALIWRSFWGCNYSLMLLSDIIIPFSLLVAINSWTVGQE